MYDRDFVLWSEETARAISGERWSAIDPLREDRVFRRLDFV
jgi:hypothetical protein